MSNTTSNSLKPLTESQSGVVFGTDTNLLVGAGAGSGKTTTVVRTICYRLGASVPDAQGNLRQTSERLELAQIAAITFTNQAAADLKRQLRKALRASGLGNLAADVDAARIGTIHAFCGDLLRDFALRAGLPPSVRVLDEGESRTITHECAERALLNAATTEAADWLTPLTSGRRLREVIADVALLASDADRLELYASRTESLRTHELRLLTLAQHTVADKLVQLRELNAYDFDRVIVATRDLLRDNADVRRAVQRQVRLLIVDEFQDVDPAQRDIALLLSGLDTREPAATRLLLVGDPKQSIFRFRRADVTLWNEMTQRFTDNPSHGKVVALTENFRSRKGILAFVDGVIGEAIAQPIAGDGVRRSYEVDYAPLDARGKDALGDECVEMLCVPAKEDGKAYSASDVRHFEAQAIATRIGELVANGRVYGDIALLLAGWGDSTVYEQALRRAGIPVYVLKSDGFWDAREIIDCVLALRAIRDGGDAVNDATALVGFLKSPFVGVRDETLLALAMNPAGWRVALATEQRERPLLDLACALLDQFHALRDRVPLAELLNRLLAASGYLASLALNTEGGAQAIANVRKLVRLAGEAHQLSLGEWLHEIELARDRGDKIAQEPLYRERADVVTITSIHSAKGLEWPVVIWGDLVRSIQNNSGSLLVGRTEFRMKDVDAVDDKGKVNDAEYNALRDAQALEEMAERYRLWYVAATRPKELLILSGIPCGTAARSTVSVAQSLHGHFSDLMACPAHITYAHTDGTEFRMVVRPIPVEPTLVNEVNALDQTIALDSPPSEVRVSAGRSRLSATQLMEFAKSPDVWWQRYAYQFEPSAQAPADSAPSARTPSTRAIGTIVHEVLERFNFELDDIDELISQAIGHHADQEVDAHGDDYRARIRALVDAALSHAHWNQMARASSARREMKFTRLLPSGDVVEGAFDLAAVVDGVSTIVDVKTGGAGDAATLANTYAMQAHVYVEAAEAIAGRDARFQLLRPSDATPIDVVADTARVAQVVRALRDAGHQSTSDTR